MLSTNWSECQSRVKFFFDKLKSSLKCLNRSHEFAVSRFPLQLSFWTLETQKSQIPGILPFYSKFSCTIVCSMSRGKLKFHQWSQRFLVLFISYLNFLNLLLNAFHLKCNSLPISLTVNLLFIVRFLRHVPVIYVDYPGPTSLTQIYGTFNRAMLRIVPPLRSYAQPLTDAMVEFYSMSQVTRSL